MMPYPDDADDLRQAPLFTQMDDRAARFDEWSYPKGILRDGMVALDENKRGLADQYFDAAEAVVKLVNDNQVADYTVSSPILYLYRHSFELYLKSLIEATGGKPGREHDLAKLLAMAPVLPDWSRSRILELHAVDPRSTHLRYGDERGQFPGPEGWAEMNFLRDAMRALRDHFVDLIERMRLNIPASVARGGIS